MKEIKQIFQYKVIEWGEHHIVLGNVISAVLILVFVFVLLRIIHYVFKRQQSKGRIDPGLSHSVYLIIKYFLLTIGFLVALETLGFKLSILLAGSAALLVGVGLGLQDTFKDMVSGIIILAEGTIHVGDVLEVGGIVGRVTSIRLRTSEIITRDGVNIIVPNHKFVTDNVINWSHNRKPTRFKVTVRVAFKSDVELVKKVLYDCVAEHKDAIQKDNQYKPLVRLADFGDSGIQFEVLFWSFEYFKYESAKSDLRFIIARKFKENDIEIPFPQRDLHIKSGTLPTE